MTIAEIKEKLTLANVLQYYHLKPDKLHRLHCPFHDDKTPSMQVYYKTQTAYCFSGNCKTHGKAMDVIDFIMHKENCSKAEAIKIAQQMIGGTATLIPAQELNRTVAAEPSRSTVLTKMFIYFKNAIHNSKPSQEYVQKRGLDFSKTVVGYNSGQFHHGTRKNQHLIDACIKLGLLKPQRSGYSSFGKGAIVFPLKNKEHKICSLYFRSINDASKAKHLYLKDRQGLYPNYPDPTTTKLILTESIIDAASLLQIKEIPENYQVLACYGTNGLTEEHQQTIKGLKQLEEVIFFFDNDPAGKAATQKYAKLFKENHQSLQISEVIPIGKDINETLQGHDQSIFIELLDKRTELLFSNEKKLTSTSTVMTLETTQPSKSLTGPAYNLQYPGKSATYHIKGFNNKQLDSLKITLQIQVI